MNELSAPANAIHTRSTPGVGAGDAPTAGAERDLAPMLSNIASLEALAADWPEAQQNAAAARVQAIEDLNAEAFKRLIRILKGYAALAPLLKEAAMDEVVYAVLRRHGILKPSLFERLEAALETIRPMLASHGGGVELVCVEPPSCAVRLLGACEGCPASQLTFYSGVKKAIQDHVPEIDEVRQVKGLGSGGGGGSGDRRPGGDTDTVRLISPFADANP